MNLQRSYPRYLRPRLVESLADTPVVLLHGARQTGKTTLARSLELEFGYAYLNFDDLQMREAAENDPESFVRSLPERVILDEVQLVPGLFSSIKSEVDRHRHPGRFILTGSANVLLIPRLSDSLAGRIEIMRLHPLAQAEIEGAGPGLIDRLFAPDFTIETIEASPDQLIERLVAGGYPAAVARTGSSRRMAWYRGYVETILERDIRELTQIRALGDLDKLLHLMAGSTAGLRNIAELSRPLSVSRPTVEEYTQLLTRLFLIDVVPAWGTNRRKRLVSTPKIHLGDTGLATALLDVDGAGVQSDDDLRGRMVETFVYQEVCRHLSWSQRPINNYHFRTRDRTEVDMVLERASGEMIGIEVKSGGSVRSKDFNGLRTLAASAASKWCAGHLFYNGTKVLPFGDRLWAVPIGMMWGA